VPSGGCYQGGGVMLVQAATAAAAATVARQHRSTSDVNHFK